MSLLFLFSLNASKKKNKNKKYAICNWQMIDIFIHIDKEYIACYVHTVSSAIQQAEQDSFWVDSYEIQDDGRKRK